MICTSRTAHEVCQVTGLNDRELLACLLLHRRKSDMAVCFGVSTAEVAALHLQHAHCEQNASWIYAYRVRRL